MFRFIDKSTKRKNTLVKDNISYINGVPIFSIVEFNIIDKCTRACSFCPVSFKDFYSSSGIKGKLKEDFLKKALDDLKDINYTGTILFSGMSEPLLHNKLDDIIYLVKSNLPKVRLEIISNGDLLSTNKLKSMFENGLDAILISMYDNAKQIEKFSKMMKEANLDESQVILRRRYYEDGNYGITVSNRGGLINTDKFRDENEAKVESLPLKKVCYYPFYMIKVDFDGDVTICSHDWKRDYIIGNINMGGGKHINI